MTPTNIILSIKSVSFILKCFGICIYLIKLKFNEFIIKYARICKCVCMCVRVNVYIIFINEPAGL